MQLVSLALSALAFAASAFAIHLQFFHVQETLGAVLNVQQRGEYGLALRVVYINTGDRPETILSVTLERGGSAPAPPEAVEEQERVEKWVKGWRAVGQDAVVVPKGEARAVDYQFESRTGELRLSDDYLEKHGAPELLFRFVVLDSHGRPHVVRVGSVSFGGTSYTITSTLTAGSPVPLLPSPLYNLEADPGGSRP